MAMNQSRRSYRFVVAAAVTLAVAVGGSLLWLKHSQEKPRHAKRIVQHVTLIAPPPPPPPPEKKPPEPEPREEPIEPPEPRERPVKAPEEAEKPAEERLGLDAEGDAGGDPFGLEARRGGRALLSRSPGSSILWFKGRIESGVESRMQSLLASTAARKSDYSVTLDIWVDGNGRIVRAELSSASGKPEMDAALRNALSRLDLVVDRPPENMPQPVKIRLISKI